jgi:hypothetical protein
MLLIEVAASRIVQVVSEVIDHALYMGSMRFDEVIFIVHEF